MKSSSVGGFSSKLAVSTGSTRHSYPARRISAASIWSWLRMCPPSGGVPGSTGRRHFALNGAVRISALWPQ